jgi:hypothetical protein
MNNVHVFLVHKKTTSIVKRIVFVSDKLSYIILRGRWGGIIFLNIHALTGDKTDDVKYSFYEE